MAKRKLKKKTKRRLLFVFIILIGISIFYFVNKDNSVVSVQKDNPKQKEKEKSKEPVLAELTVSFAGDCTFGSDSAWGYSGHFDSWFKNEAKEDTSYYLKEVKYIFAESDYSVVNLEGVLTKDAPKYPWVFPWGKIWFKGDPIYANILKDGNIDAASIGNNHSYDYGEQGVQDTINALRGAGVDYFGFDEVLIKDIKGIKLAFIAFNYIDEPHSTKEDMTRTINKAKELKADYIFAYLHHWDNDSQGKYVASTGQRENAYWILDQGVDIIIGAHPHVPQGIEKYNDKLIIHSLGHLSFGGNRNPGFWARRGLIAQINLTFEDNLLIKENLKLIPIEISTIKDKNNYQPYVLEGSAKQEVIDHVNKYSYNYIYED